MVNHLIRGGSAERSGTIKAGDMIVSIDSRDVRGKSVSEMRNYIVGAEGSTVILGFVRPEGGEYTAQLVRGSPEFIASMGSASGAVSAPLEERPVSQGQRLVLSAQRQSAGKVASGSNLFPPSQGPAAALPGGRASAQGDPSQLLREVAMQAEREKLQAEAVARELAVQLEEERRVQRMAAMSTSMDGQALKDALAEREAAFERERAEYDQALRSEILKRQHSENRASHAKAERGEGEAYMLEIERLRQQLDEERRAREAAERQRDSLYAQGQGAAESDADLLRAREREVVTLRQELRRAREEGKTAAVELQEALLASQSNPVALDAEFRDIGRLAILAVPHLVAHLQTTVDNQDKIRAITPVTSVMVQALEHARARAVSCIPQSVPQLVALLVSKQLATVRESSFALALTSMSPEGRQAILAIPQAVPHLATLLDSPDVHARRHGATALGNLAMDASGRRAILDIFSVVNKFVELLGSADLDSCRSAALAVGNLVIEDEARTLFLAVGEGSAVAALAEQLKSADRFLVRYATGAIRNVAVDERGRRAILSQQEAVAALKGLLASPDQTTAKFAVSALKNLSMTPFSSTSGPGAEGTATKKAPRRVQVPERTEEAFWGLQVPWADYDGLGIPQTIPPEETEQRGSISL